MVWCHGVGMLLYIWSYVHTTIQMRRENLRSYPWVATHPAPLWLPIPCLGWVATQVSGRDTPPLSVSFVSVSLTSYFFLSCRLLFSFSWKILHKGIFSFEIRTTTPLSPNQRPLPPSPRGDEGGGGEVSKNIISAPYLPQKSMYSHLAQSFSSLVHMYTMSLHTISPHHPICTHSCPLGSPLRIWLHQAPIYYVRWPWLVSTPRNCVRNEWGTARRGGAGSGPVKPAQRSKASRLGLESMGKENPPTSNPALQLTLSIYQNMPPKTVYPWTLPYMPYPERGWGNRHQLCGERGRRGNILNDGRIAVRKE